MAKLGTHQTQPLAPQIQRQERLRALQVRCQVEREYLVRQAAELKDACTMLDLASKTISKLNNSPTVIKSLMAALTGLVVIAVVRKPQRLAGITRTAVRAWSLWQKVAPVIRQFRQRSARQEDLTG